MAYTLDFSLALGSSKTGLTLVAQIVDTAGANTGAAVSTGFTEIGTGYYLWHYAAFPDDHRGGVKFYESGVPATILAFASINPEEAEYTDIAVSGDAARVWAYATRTLTTPVPTTATYTAAALEEIRGDSWTIDITGLPTNTGYTAIWWTVKDDPGDADTASILQVKLNSPDVGSGLIYVNGAAATDATKASITVLSSTSIRIAVDESITAAIALGQYYQDVQTLISGAVNTPSKGTIDVVYDVTRSVT